MATQQIDGQKVDARRRSQETEDNILQIAE
jgi:hypothetical protein